MQFCDIFPEDNHRSGPVLAHWDVYCWISTYFFSQQQQQVLIKRHRTSGHLNTSLKRPASPFSCFFFVLATAHPMDKISDCISSESIDIVFGPQLLAPGFHFKSYTVFQFLLRMSKIQWICVHFHLFQLVYVMQYRKKKEVHFQIS